MFYQTLEIRIYSTVIAEPEGSTLIIAQPGIGHDLQPVPSTSQFYIPSP
jgi:hypothetical protein